MLSLHHQPACTNNEDDFEYEDGFQAGLETETLQEYQERLSYREQAPRAPESWYAGLNSGFLQRYTATK